MPIILLGFVVGGLVHQAVHAVVRHERNREKIERLEEKVNDLAASK